MSGHRQLNFWMCLALVMGTMIGSGVFLLPASLAPYGWNAVPGWLITIGGALMLALSLARLTRALPHADGPHGFVKAAFGDLPAFLIAWSYWVSMWIGNAAIAMAAVSYFSLFAPVIARVPGLPAALTIVLVWIIAMINIRGARSAGGFQLATTLIKIIPLAVVIVLTLWVVLSTRGAALAPFPAQGLTLASVSAASSLTLWAMLGFEAASLASAHVERADEVVPRATIIGASLTGLIYLIACSGIALLLPAGLAATSHAPFADFVARYWSPGPALFVGLFAAISAIGALNGVTLLLGAIPRSLARAGSFPAWFGVTNAAGVPARGMLVGAALTTILLLLNSARGMTDMFTFLALMSTSSTLFLYFGIATAALRLRVGGAIGVAATGFALWAFYGAGLEANAWSSVLLLAGIPIFWGVRRSGAAAQPAE